MGTFKICPNNDVSQDPTQDCFDQSEHLLRVMESNSSTYTLPSSNTGKYSVRLQLPEGLQCQQCIIQWTYTAGNNWGVCEDGTGALGCGPQEHFRACADVTIRANSDTTSGLYSTSYTESIGTEETT